MWSYFELLVLVISQFGLCFSTQIVSTNADKDCSTSCLKCGTSGCLKCLNLLTYPTRECVTKCPHGFRIQWSTFSDYMGRICVHRESLFGLSGQSLTILTGILTGTVFCIVIISLAVIYVQKKRKALVENYLDDSVERKEFLKQLEVLKPYAGNFLEILNDTRKQVRESHRDGDNSAVAVYKPIVRDLAKILLILNRSSDGPIPEDWEHLFNFGEKTLKRCKRLSEVSQPQVAQLINFLQGPIDGEVTRPSMSTFKQPFGSSNSLQEVAVKSFNENYESNLNPQWKFDYTLINNYQSSQFSPAYFLDDDFCLGFRPQDEITTEL